MCVPLVPPEASPSLVRLHVAWCCRWPTRGMLSPGCHLQPAAQLGESDVRGCLSGWCFKLCRCLHDRPCSPALQRELKPRTRDALHTRLNCWTKLDEEFNLDSKASGSLAVRRLEAFAPYHQENTQPPGLARNPLALLSSSGCATTVRLQSYFIGSTRQQGTVRIDPEQ